MLYRPNNGYLTGGALKKVYMARLNCTDIPHDIGSDQWHDTVIRVADATAAIIHGKSMYHQPASIYEPRAYGSVTLVWQEQTTEEQAK
eukprot:snap_masked-scaffold_31-processed-gene-2.12-mRNA-1 protein AED:1.00 eAED:1.00 QI:0/-1/0/0/-1/1/1/0/87